MQFIRVEYGKKARDISNRRFKSYTYGQPQCDDQRAGTKARSCDFFCGWHFGVSALEAMSAAKATVTDMGSFCGRQPDACSVGSQAAVAIGHRAQAGAKMLYDYFNEHFGSQDAGTAANAANGTALPLPNPRPSQHTLSPADLAPGWRGPQSRKDTRSDRPT
jgi:hypothetical protein